jgi:hypothetical protein
MLRGRSKCCAATANAAWTQQMLRSNSKCCVRAANAVSQQILLAHDRTSTQEYEL